MLTCLFSLFVHCACISSCGKGGCDGDVCRDAPSVSTVTAFDVFRCLYLASLRNGNCWCACTHKGEGEGFIKHSCLCPARVTSFWYVLNGAVGLYCDESRAVHDFY